MEYLYGPSKGDGSRSPIRRIEKRKKNKSICPTCTYSIYKSGIFTINKVIVNHLGPKYISRQNDKEFVSVKKLPKNPSLRLIESRASSGSS
jgi:ribosomal protein L37AE/L43A